MNILRRSTAALGPLAMAAFLAVFAAGCSSEPGAASTPSGGTGDTEGSAESTFGEAGGAADKTSESSPAAGETGDAAEKAAKSASAASDAAKADEKADKTDGKLPKISQVDTAQLASVLDETKGKVTVLNIWATWCGPCAHEMPDLTTFYDETDRESVAFVSLSIDDVAEVTGAIPEFQEEYEMPFPVYVLNERDMEGLEKALRGGFSGAIPATYIYDRDGGLAETKSGVISLSELRKEVDQLM